jgi:2-polyprenyl-6-methoxyphenol hydroxylase-like FAD-dependent oxidoreductase
MSRIEALNATPNSNRPRIAIAGAGIGGLALALALVQRGFAPVVFERRSEAAITGDGLFLTLAPNGLNALRGLGLAEAVLARGLSTEGLAIYNERGRELGLIDYRGHGAAFGAPSATVRRGDLAAVLLGAARAAGIALHLEGPITGIEEGADGVTVSTGEESAGFDMLVASDGLRSTVRRLVFPDLPEPVYSGLVGNGGVIDVPEVPATNGIMRMTFGREAFFGYLKEGDGPVLWFDTYPAEESELGIGDPEAYAAAVAARHRGDPLDNFRIVSAVRSISRNFPVFDMPSLPRWSSGRVLLMGDAAHAVAPHSGQGASMAIEDALVLAACLDTGGPVEAVFRRFEGLRRQRVETAIAIGRQAGSQKHAQSWLERRIRDLILPLVLPLGRKAQERMFGFRADLNPLAQPVQ